MSVESFERKYKSADGAESILRRPEFQRGHSVMRSLAESFYHEGSIGIKSTHAKLLSEGWAIPDSPQLVPPRFNGLMIRNSGAMLWGSLFLTTEKTIVDREYDPLFLSQLMRKGFEGTPWYESTEIYVSRPEALTPEEIDPLTQLAMDDETFTFLFSKTGFGRLPETLQEDVKDTGLYDDMTDEFWPILYPIIELLRRDD